MGGAGSPTLWPGTAPDDPGTAGCSGAHGLRFGEEAVLREHADPAWRVARDDEAFVVDARVGVRSVVAQHGVDHAQQLVGGGKHGSLVAETASQRAVTADTAYDTVAFYAAASARDARVVVPPARTASLSRHGPRSRARDRTIRRVQILGCRRWKKASRYPRQARIENVVFRYKSIIGPGLRARTEAGRQTEALLACDVLNRMTELGRPASYRIGR